MNTSNPLHVKEFTGELENILRFWQSHTPDEKNQGFFGEISNDLKVNEAAPKGGVLNARILWTFSAAALQSGNPAYRAFADRAYHYFSRHFFDSEYGGTYWMVDAQGSPLETRKQTYAQAFSIYALTEYARLTGENEPLDLAMQLFGLIERHALDPERNGYPEAFDRKWNLHEDQRLSAIDMNERKSMNTHLHVIEAYANLFRLTGNQQVKQRVENLLGLFDRFIIHSKTRHFNLFFDESWNVRSQKVSYGHDIEGSWLLLESAESIDSPEWISRMKTISVEMAGASLEGIDNDGGLRYEMVPGEPDNGEKEWWTMAEAVVGFYNAYQLSGDKIFLRQAAGMWNFLKTFVIDHERGEWYYRIDRNHRPDDSYPKVSQWKCPYHNARMCLEMIRRLG